MIYRVMSFGLGKKENSFTCINPLFREKHLEDFDRKDQMSKKKSNVTISSKIKPKKKKHLKNMSLSVFYIFEITCLKILSAAVNFDF